MLGRWPSDDLRAQALAEAAGRQSAVHAEDTAMRRLERDLHDGPQQRLVRLQMDLATVERRAASGDAEQAVEVAKQAQLQAKAALDELRALSRGVAPPLLADRGLRAALAALAEESAVPVHARLDPAIDTAVSSDVARAVYFIAAELLTNVTKHADAASAQLVVEVSQLQPARLLLSVSDDGRGGAELRPSHGLAGLDALELRRELPEVAVLVLSQYVETVYARELLADARGGVGYLLKDRVTSLDEFADAITRVAAGGTVLDPEVVRRLLAASSDPLAGLTARERDVLALIAEGHSNLGIAEKLVIGTGAVEKHVTSLFTKLGLSEDAADHRRVLAVLAYLQR